MRELSGLYHNYKRITSMIALLNPAQFRNFPGDFFDNASKEKIYFGFYGNFSEWWDSKAQKGGRGEGLLRFAFFWWHN